MARQTLDQIALKRALSAIERVRRQTDNFDNGDYASHEIMNVMRDGLRKEFTSKEANPHG